MEELKRRFKGKVEDQMLQLIYESVCNRDFNLSIKAIEKSMTVGEIKLNGITITLDECMLLCQGYIRLNLQQKYIPKVLKQMIIQFIGYLFTENDMKIQIYIKSMIIGNYPYKFGLNGENILNETVENIKLKIQNKVDVPPEQQILMTVGNRTLENGRTLSDYNIQNCATLILKPRFVDSDNVNTKSQQNQPRI